MKKLSSASEFHDFEKQPLIVGVFKSVVLREQDSADGTQKAGTVLGYELEPETGEAVIVGNSHMVEKAIVKSGLGAVLGVRFLGKTTNSKNQPVNRFEVIEFDGEHHNGNGFAEALAYYGEKAVG